LAASDIFVRSACRWELGNLPRQTRTKLAFIAFEEAQRQCSQSLSGEWDSGTSNVPLPKFRKCAWLGSPRRLLFLVHLYPYPANP
jgi:hypothetical protein